MQKYHDLPSCYLNLLLNTETAVWVHVLVDEVFHDSFYDW
jgi:hypothetical protein